MHRCGKNIQVKNSLNLERFYSLNKKTRKVPFKADIEKWAVHQKLFMIECFYPNQNETSKIEIRDM